MNKTEVKDNRYSKKEKPEGKISAFTHDDMVLTSTKNERMMSGPKTKMVKSRQEFYKVPSQL